MGSVTTLFILLALAYFPQYGSAGVYQINPANAINSALYKFRLDNNDGSSRAEVEKLLNPGAGNENLFAIYAIELNGNLYIIKYTTEQNGYGPVISNSNELTSVAQPFGVTGSYAPGVFSSRIDLAGSDISRGSYPKSIGGGLIGGGSLGGGTSEFVQERLLKSLAINPKKD